MPVISGTAIACATVNAPVHLSPEVCGGAFGVPRDAVSLRPSGPDRITYSHRGHERATSVHRSGVEHADPACPPWAVRPMVIFRIGSRLSQMSPKWGTRPIWWNRSTVTGGERAGAPAHRGDRWGASPGGCSPVTAPCRIPMGRRGADVTGHGPPSGTITHSRRWHRLGERALIELGVDGPECGRCRPGYSQSHFKDSGVILATASSLTAPLPRHARGEAPVRRAATATCSRPSRAFSHVVPTHLHPRLTLRECRQCRAEHVRVLVVDVPDSCAHRLVQHVEPATSGLP